MKRCLTVFRLWMCLVHRRVISLHADLCCGQPLVSIVTPNSRVRPVVLGGVKVFHAGIMQDDACASLRIKVTDNRLVQRRCHYLSVSGCGRQRLLREGRSRVSGFLSSLQACMFRYLNMCTLPFRQIWNIQTGFFLTVTHPFPSTRWSNCTTFSQTWLCDHIHCKYTSGVWSRFHTTYKHKHSLRRKMHIPVQVETA